LDQPCIIVLASGRGERYRASGGGTHKLQAQLGALTVLQHTVQAATASGLRVHVEDRGHPGMGDSIAAAVRLLPDASAWLILAGDLPLVLPQTIQRVAQAAMDHLVVRPSYQGRHGHPVRFHRSCRQDLLALTGDQGAAGLVQQIGAHSLAVDDPGCVTDIDTVDDLQRAQTLLAQRLGA
jgi:molybdenum cofactor cytidylyltransferase